MGSAQGHMASGLLALNLHKHTRSINEPSCTHHPTPTISNLWPISFHDSHPLPPPRLLRSMVSYGALAWAWPWSRIIKEKLVLVVVCLPCCVSLRATKLSLLRGPLPVVTLSILPGLPLSPCQGTSNTRYSPKSLKCRNL